MTSKNHRRCGHCNGVLPIAERQCPYCGASLENYGALGRLVDSILPEDAGVTKVLGGLAVGLYLVIGLAAGGTGILAQSIYTLIHFGAGFTPAVLDGEIWRVVTPIFLHGGVLHIGFNLYALWLLGPVLERSFGRARYLIAFMLTGVLSTAAALGWKVIAPSVFSVIPFADRIASASINTPMVGMSGSLCGLLGMGVTAGHRVGNEAGTAIRNRSLRWMGFLVVFGLIVPNVDNAAHLAGFVVGAAVGWILPLKDRPGYVAGWFWAGGAALCSLLIVGSVAAQLFSLPRHLPHDLDFYPTAIFGNSVRDGDREDNLVTDAEAACKRSLSAIDRGDTSRKMTAQAVANCDEVLHYVPFVPQLWALSAQAHLANGDRATGCRRIGVAQAITRWDPNFQDAQYAQLLRSYRTEACP